MCSNFIVSDRCGTAQFAHASVREYLGRRQTDTIQEYGPERVNVQVATTCLAYLNRWKHIMKQKWILEKGFLYDEYSVLAYSIFYWAPHMAAILPENRPHILQNLYAALISANDDETSSPVQEWFESLCRHAEGHTLVEYEWWEACASLPPLLARCDPGSQPHRLLPACIWGLVDMLPENVVLIDDEQLLTTGLREACRSGHAEIVRFLFGERRRSQWSR